MVYWKFWFAFCFCVLNVLVLLSQTRIEACDAFLGRNFALLRSGVGCAAVQVLVVVIYPYNLAAGAYLVGSVLMFVSAGIAVAALVLDLIVRK